MADQASIKAARASWAECERQLYPMAVADPARYQQMIIAVRALADEMHTVASIEQLVTLWPRAGQMLVTVVAARGVPVQSLPQEQVAGAAFALREREIRELSRRQALQDHIGAARQSGDVWVVLDESGRIDAGLFDPYRCTEMHVASGLAVMSHVQPDPGCGIASFVVTVVKLDPLTGELLDADPGIGHWVEHSKQEDFVAHRDAVRDRISSRSIEGSR